MIGIVDYGLGNIRAFANVYKRSNVPCKIVAAREDLPAVDKIILPGVGAFDHAMTLLNKSGLRPELERKVFEQHTPLLGVCIGMHMLADRSEEGKLPGLGWIKGRVNRMDTTMITHQTRLPHMGWNEVHPSDNEPLFRDLRSGSRYYFLHSYCFHSDNSNESIAITEYGVEFTSAVRSGNLWGVQFHPEKSHHAGLRLLKNFGEM
jgi:imidazole glycerol-phosphate synthase subunit HisH